MKIYKHRSFHQWAKRERLSNKTLKQVVAEIENGLFEVNLGGGLYKKRIAISGKGKSGGYRILLAFKQNQSAFFVYGFLKNAQGNINENELKSLKYLAKEYLYLDKYSIQQMIENGQLFEVADNEKDTE